MDFGLAADDYARHRAGFPEETFDRLSRFGVGAPGQLVLDVGTGTGSLAHGFARRGCRVLGVDPSAPLLREARRIGGAAGLEVAYLRGRAETLALRDGSLDVVSAGQCWHWFDRPRAAREVRRVLAPEGHLVIAHFDWLGGIGTVVDETQKLVRRFQPDWHTLSSTGLYPRWLHDVARAGLSGIETFSFDTVVPYTHVRWRGRIRASAGVGASLPPAEVERFDASLADLLRRRFPAEPLEVPHRTWVVVAARGEAGPAH